MSAAGEKANTRYSRFALTAGEPPALHRPALHLKFVEHNRQTEVCGTCFLARILITPFCQAIIQLLFRPSILEVHPQSCLLSLRLHSVSPRALIK